MTDRPATAKLPWQARARVLAQRVGVDTRHLRRARWLHKARAVRRSGASVMANLPFVLASPEPDNFTFEIANQRELGQWAAAAARCDRDAADTYVSEPQLDETLRARLRRATAGHWLWSAREPPYGKRLGWYALVRALRPALVVEVAGRLARSRPAACSSATTRRSPARSARWPANTGSSTPSSRRSRSHTSTRVRCSGLRGGRTDDPVRPCGWF